MLVKPTVLELLEKVDNRFRLVTVTSKRARQIAEGSTPLTRKDEPSPVSLAADEIAEEAIINFDLDGNGKIDLQEFTNLINFFIEEKGLKI